MLSGAFRFLYRPFPAFSLFFKPLAHQFPNSVHLLPQMCPHSVCLASLVAFWPVRLLLLSMMLLALWC